MSSELLHLSDESRRPGFGPIDGNLRCGLALLFQAFCYARNANVSQWDFAMEIEKLCAAGMTISDLRLLVARGFVEHGRELSVYGDPHRTFQTAAGFFFEAGTCVVLTARGAAYVRDLLHEPAPAPEATPGAGPAPHPHPDRLVLANLGQPPTIRAAGGPHDHTRRPLWVSMKRELCLEGTVIKRFRVPARNQELILSTFEDDGWPEYVDDPLPVSRGVDPKTRLHDAINRLNHSQENPLIRFHGNGSGTGILWKFRLPVALRSIDSP